MRRFLPGAALTLLLPAPAVAQTPRLTETGTPGEPIRFAGADYAAGEPVEATYTFNSYRLTYRYRVLGGDRSTAWIGFTAKIRDATIALEQGPTSSRKDDLSQSDHPPRCS